MKKFLAEANTYEPVHNYRYEVSYAHIEPWLNETTKVLELGGNNEYLDNNPIPNSSPFAKLLTTANGCQVDSPADFDLRYKFPIKDNLYDLVTCMEVLEHIKDQDSKDIKSAAVFNFDGILNLLRESYRVTKPGGWMFISTPNVCSLRNLHRLVHSAHPYFWQPHNRELASEDVARLSKAAGWEVADLQTPTVWNHHGLNAATQKMLLGHIVDMGGSRELRGDCIFAKLRKNA